ncbi:MAG: DoxX family protein [Deltaproteobacteria bacterium]|nr:DoxX family protein [Deltaproteobacteria bacterium]
MKTKLLYWIPTMQILLVSVLGGLLDAVQTDEALQVFRHLGYPDYFSTLLGVAKILGAIALVLPVSRTVKEWAYAGLTFDLGGAIVSILAVGDPAWRVAIPVYAMVMLQLSRYAWSRRAREAQLTPAAAT